MLFATESPLCTYIPGYGHNKSGAAPKIVGAAPCEYVTYKNSDVMIPSVDIAFKVLYYLATEFTFGRF